MILSEYISNLKIKVYTGNCTLCPPSWSGYNVSSAFHKLYFPIEGSAHIISANQNYLLKEGQMMLIPKGITHSFHLTEEKHLKKYWIHFSAISDGSDLFTAFPEITLWDFQSKPVLNQFTLLFDTLFSLSDDSSISSSLQKQAILFSIFSLIFSQVDQNNEDKLKLGKTKSTIIIEYIEKHLSEPIKVETLASLLYMHPTAFIRYFKNHFGMPPLKYIKCLRLEQAKLYLETSELPIGEIAEMTGFGNLSHLSRDFKATYGITPSQGRIKRT